MYPVIDSKEASSWVFPTNMSVRKYQVDICRTALENNTLVCLPTGLGKTLIAAVLVYNFYRFFPDGKIVFMAPTKPLVAQQFKACSDIMRLPENDVILLEGSVSPSKRELKWKEARVFFITPQTLANDLESGVVSPATARKFVLVVADEAHRATDGYAYTHIVQHFTKCNNKFRVLALSATPGSDLRAVQTVIYNLNIARIEIRSEEDPGVAEFTHLKQVELITCSDTTALKFRRRNSHYFSEDTDDDADPYAGVDLFHDVPSSLKGRGKGSIPRGGPVVSPNSAQDSTIINHLTALMGPPVSFLASHSVLMSDNPGAVTSFIVQDAERNVAQKLRDLFDPNRVVNVNANANTAQSRAMQQERTLRASLSSALSVLTFLVKCKNSYLGVHGGVGARSAPSLRVMLEDMQVETESSLSGGAVAGAEGEQCLEKRSFQQALVTSAQFRQLMSYLRSIRNVPGGGGANSPSSKNALKVKKLRELLVEHFRRRESSGASTRVIIFAELRSTVFDIVAQLSDLEGVRPFEFVGQSGSTSSTTSTFTDHGSASSRCIDPTLAGQLQLKDIQLNRLRAGGGNGSGLVGLNQHEQAQVISLFHRGDVNVLVATCIAEEGLDIGDVDLIVLFDSVASPTRLVQRMGRTGRKRAGRVVMLLGDGDGKEAAKVEKCSLASEQIMAALYNPTNKLSMYKNDQRLLPHPSRELELVYRNISGNATTTCAAPALASVSTSSSSSRSSSSAIACSGGRNISSLGNEQLGGRVGSGAAVGASASYGGPGRGTGSAAAAAVGVPRPDPSATKKHQDVISLLDDSDEEEVVPPAPTSEQSSRAGDVDDIWGFGSSAPTSVAGASVAVASSVLSRGTAKDSAVASRPVSNCFGSNPSKPPASHAALPVPNAAPKLRACALCADSLPPAVAASVVLCAECTFTCTASLAESPGATQETAPLAASEVSPQVAAVQCPTADVDVEATGVDAEADTRVNKDEGKDTAVPESAAERLARQFARAAEAGRRLVAAEVHCADYEQLLVVGRVLREEANAAVATSIASMKPIDSDPAAPPSAAGGVSAPPAFKFTVDLSDGEDDEDDDDDEDEDDEDDEDEEIVLHRPTPGASELGSPAAPPTPASALVGRSAAPRVDPTKVAHAPASVAAPPAVVTAAAPSAAAAAVASDNAGIWGFQLGAYIQASPGSPMAPTPAMSLPRHSATHRVLTTAPVVVLESDSEAEAEADLDGDLYAGVASRRSQPVLARNPTTASCQPTVSKYFAPAASKDCDETLDVIIDDADDFCDESLAYGCAAAAPLPAYATTGISQAPSKGSNKLPSTVSKVMTSPPKLPLSNRRLVADSPESQRKSISSQSESPPFLPRAGALRRSARAPTTAAVNIAIDDDSSSESYMDVSAGGGDSSDCGIESHSTTASSQPGQSKQSRVAENGSDDKDEDEEEDEEEEDVDDMACAVCADPGCEPSDVNGVCARTMLLCDGGCEAGVHVECYFGEDITGSRKKLRELKMLDFYCDGCESSRHASGHHKKPCCALCRVPGGMLKRNNDGSFVHQMCALFTPELVFDPRTRQVTNMGDMWADRMTLVCKECRGKGGAVVQCAFGQCTVAAHPYCAFQKERQLVIRREVGGSSSQRCSQRPFLEADEDDSEEEEEDSRGYLHEFYCRDHKHRISGSLRDIIFCTVPMAGLDGGRVGRKGDCGAGNENRLNYSDEFGLNNTQCVSAVKAAPLPGGGGKLTRLKKKATFAAVAPTVAAEREAAKAKKARLKKKAARDVLRTLAARNTRNLVAASTRGCNLVDDEAILDCGEYSDGSENEDAKSRAKERARLKAAGLALLGDDEEEEGEDWDGYESSFINDGEYTQFVPASDLKGLKGKRYSSAGDSSADKTPADRDKSKRLRRERQQWEDEQAMYLRVNRDLEDTPIGKQHVARIGPRFALNLTTAAAGARAGAGAGAGAGAINPTGNVDGDDSDEYDSSFINDGEYTQYASDQESL